MDSVLYYVYGLLFLNPLLYEASPKSTLGTANFEGASLMLCTSASSRHFHACAVNQKTRKDDMPSLCNTAHPYNRLTDFTE